MVIKATHEGESGGDLNTGFRGVFWSLARTIVSNCVQGPGSVNEGLTGIWSTVEEQPQLGSTEPHNEHFTSH